MHELSLARAIVSEVSEAAVNHEIARVGVVEMKVGVLCGVIVDSLQFAFEFAAVGTPLEGAQLEFVSSEVTMWCESCQVVVQPREKLVFSCPNCHSPCPELRSGRELEIVRFTERHEDAEVMQ